MGDLETYLLCPTDVEGTIDVLAWKACDYEGRRRSVSARRKERTLVPNVRQNTMLREWKDEEYQERHEIIEHVK